MVLLIALGGGIGSLLRWGIASTIPRSSNGFPVGITVVNVVGSFLLAVLVGLALAGRIDAASVPITIGLLGGFTTFSTWMVDIEEAETTRMSVAVAVIPAVLGLAAAALGLIVGLAP